MLPMSCDKMLYQVDPNGRLRFWQVQVDFDSYFTETGLLSSSGTRSKPKYCSDPDKKALALFFKHKKEGWYESEEEALTSAYKEPMLANVYDRENLPADGFFLMAQPKLDGMRCIVNSKGMFSRKGREITSCGHIYEALRPYLSQGLVFDGELYAHGLSLQQIISYTRRRHAVSSTSILIKYHVYDLVQDQSAYSRYMNYQELKLTDPIVPVQAQICHRREELDLWHAQYVAEGYEGSIYRQDWPYYHGRSDALLKRKDFYEIECIATGFAYGEGNWDGIPKTLTCQTANGEQFIATMVGDMEYCREIGRRLSAEGSIPNVTVKYTAYTDAGVPKCANVKLIRDYED